MKKLFLFGLMAVCLYKSYQYLSASYDKGPVAADGTLIAQLFVGPNCNQYCSEIEGMLKSRQVNYVVVDVTSPEGGKFGVNQYPLTKVGKRSVLGNARPQLVALLAESYGEAVLTPGERMAMQGHFDANGKPLVVLYGTSWCGYCKRQREYFAAHNVPFVNIDVERSSSGKLAYDTLQANGYPLVYVGYRRFDGYKEKEILDAVAELI